MEEGKKERRDGLKWCIVGGSGRGNMHEVCTKDALNVISGTN